MTDFVFRHVDEKDVDMLVMDRLATGGALLGLLTSLVSDEMPGGPSAYKLTKVRHSAVTRNGESDLVAVLEAPDNIHAILIEDKIDAPPQRQQAERYEQRGKEGVAARDWNTFSVVLIAPEEYPKSYKEPYAHVLSYQQMREALADDDDFGRRMLSDAIAKQAEGWQPNHSEVMSAFYDEVARTARKMRIKAECSHKVGDRRAERTAWVHFESPLAGTRISWKSEQGRVMLEFRGWGSSVDALKELVGEIPADAYWRAPKKGVKKAFLCMDSLYKVERWSEATADAPLIVDSMYKVQRMYDFALALNNRAIDWKGARERAVKS